MDPYIILGLIMFTLPIWAAYKVGHENGYKAAHDADREIIKVNRELYGDCPECGMELNSVRNKRMKGIRYV